MATKPQLGQRWPRNQEQRRRRTIETAQDAIEILQAARQELVENRTKAELYIADAQRYLEMIRREMTEARDGVEAPEDHL